MSKHHIIIAAGLGVGILVSLAGGCASDEPAAPHPGSTALFAPPSTEQSATGASKGHSTPDKNNSAGQDEPSPEDAARLAQRTQAYAQEIAQKLQQDSANATTAQPPQATAKPSTADASKNGDGANRPIASEVNWQKPDRPAGEVVEIPANQSASIPAADVPQTPADSDAKAAVDSSSPAQPPREIVAANVPTAGQASGTADVRSAGSSSASLSRRLEKQIRENPRDVIANLDYQLLQFVQDQQVPDLSVMAGLPQEDREIISALMDGLSNFRSAVRSDGNMLLGRKIRPLLDMDTRLRSQSDLVINNLTLCKKVERFGVYEPIEPARFIAGREQPVIIYCAIENFSSQYTDKKLWETHLTQESVLYTESGLNVWSDKTTSIVDQSRQRRNDFFVVKMIRLPANLTIGQYLLKVTIVDQQASRVAEATVPLQIVAK